MCVAAQTTYILPWNIVGPQLRNLQSKHLFRISYLLAHAQACYDKAYIRATSLSQVLSLVKGLCALSFDQSLRNYDIFLTSFSYLSVIIISLLSPFASLSLCLLVFLSFYLSVFLSGFCRWFGGFVWWMGWDVWMAWMVIIGHRSSKSTFGANKRGPASVS